MRITTLIENSPSATDPRLAAEWGLSLHIECRGRRILLDTGASAAFARNAALLGIDLAAVDAAVLSHHHYDHGGGLRRFLELNDAAPVYLGEAPGGECWARRYWVMRRYIGLDRTLFAEYDARWATVRATVEILPGVFLFPHIHGAYTRPAGNRILFLKTPGGFRPDDFRHEIAMAVKENGGLVVFTGCAHNGVANILETVARAFPGVPVRAVMGGFHLAALRPFNTLADRRPAIAAVGRAVRDFSVGEIWTGHCTAPRAFTVLKGVMGARLKAMYTGAVIDL